VYVAAPPPPADDVVVLLARESAAAGQCGAAVVALEEIFAARGKPPALGDMKFVLQQCCEVLLAFVAW